MLKVFAVSIIFAVVATACTTENSSATTFLSGENDIYCSPGQIPHWENDGNVICQNQYAWPPQRTGSRALPAPCSIAYGSYHITWKTQVDVSIVPAFTISDGMEFHDTFVELTGKIDSVYDAQWESMGYAEMWDQSGRIVSFTAQCADDNTITGTYIADLPYLQPGNQVQTWSFTGTRM